MPRRIANLPDSKLGSSPPMATAPKYDPSRPHGCCSARGDTIGMISDSLRLYAGHATGRGCTFGRLKRSGCRFRAIPMGFHGDQDAHPFSSQRSPPSGGNPSDQARIRRLRRMSRPEGCGSEGFPLFQPSFPEDLLFHPHRFTLLRQEIQSDLIRLALEPFQFPSLGEFLNSLQRFR